jgi:hypothetical protein
MLLLYISITKTKSDTKMFGFARTNNTMYEDARHLVVMMEG